MKRSGWLIILGMALVGLSAYLYFFHFLIFDDPHHIFIYMLGDLAFLPIDILLVTLVIHRLLSVREKRSRLQKLNMVIGTFFSEVGTKLLARFSDCDPRLGDIKKDLVVTREWGDREFARVTKKLRTHDYVIDGSKADLKSLKGFMRQHRDFLVSLLENPNLLEHESFTELLQAAFHLAEELAFRKDIDSLPESDRDHIAIDIQRVYRVLAHQWLDYMRHLKDSYPYLFSLAMRTNPFDAEASPVVDA